MNFILSHCALMHDALAFYYFATGVFFIAIAVAWRHLRSLLETRLADILGVVLFLGCAALAYCIL